MGRGSDGDSLEPSRTATRLPWDADPGYGPWKNDISLEEDQIAAILRWVSSGAPRGNGEEPAFESRERSGEWAHFANSTGGHEFDP